MTRQQKRNAAAELRRAAFEIGTALFRKGVSVILTGGSAATIEVPEVYVSMDIDFVMLYPEDGATLRGVMAGLGYSSKPDGAFVRPGQEVFVEFLPPPLAVGSDDILEWRTLRQGDQILQVLTLTDIIRDRLASYFWFRDQTALNVAVAVGRANLERIDLHAIEAWAKRETEEPKFAEFRERLRLGL